MGSGDTTETKMWSLPLVFHSDFIDESSMQLCLFERSVISREISSKGLDDLVGICTRITFQVKNDFCITMTTPLDHLGAS